MSKFKISLGVLALLLVGSVTAVSVDYYYHPECGHCEKIAPFISDMSSKNNDIKWSLFDTSKGSYDVDGTPMLILRTSDGREIKMEGSYEIPRYLECEINEISTLDCPTTSYLNCETNSFFVR